MSATQETVIYFLKKTYNYKTIPDRIIALDMNPDYIGYSVIDWLGENKYNIIKTGSFSLKPLNDYQDSLCVSSDDLKSKYITNKRNHELIHIANQLFTLCKHFRCETFAIENLKFNQGDRGFGHKFNRLVNNQWNRNVFIQQLKKHLDLSPTIFVKIDPEYSSVAGNLLYRHEKLPDEVLASIEINRRAFELVSQRFLNRRPVKKCVLFPDLESVKSQLIQSLEELGFDVPDFKSTKEIFTMVKKSGKKYRFSLLDVPSESLFSKFYKQKYLIVYNFK